MNIHISSPLHRPPAAKIQVVCKKMSFPKTTEMRNHILYFQVAPTALGPVHRVERQELMVTSREEMSVRVWKGGFMANLLLR